MLLCLSARCVCQGDGCFQAWLCYCTPQAFVCLRQVFVTYVPASNRRAFSVATEQPPTADNHDGSSARIMAFTMQVWVVYSAGNLLIIILALLTALPLLIFATLGYFHAKHKAETSVPDEYFYNHRYRFSHPRWKNPWIEVRHCVAVVQSRCFH